ncbi:MAG: twin-arginine translocase TatA/TatE family subunit [Nitrospirae bacterium]|nr:twin-arginine translocase TatA/TatE family subunit [Nitrospirota bacterium]
MFGIGLPEMAVILIVLLFIFGPSRLPQIGKSLGGAISGFKNAINEDKTPDKIEKS